MATASRPLFLIDAGEMYAGHSAASDRSALPCGRAHLLDTPERLLSCFELVRAKQPEARVLAFLESSGCDVLSRSLPRGASAPLETSTALQCVPFGCQVSAFLMEYARLRAVGASEVVIVSNNADVVVQAQLPDTRWRHLGFMFVEEELVLPGLALSASSVADISLPLQPPLCNADTASSTRLGVSVSLAGVQGVQKTISKDLTREERKKRAQRVGLPILLEKTVRSGSHLGGPNQLLQRQASSRISKDALATHQVASAKLSIEGRRRDVDIQETQPQDSQLDGEAWHSAGGSCSIEADDGLHFAETQVVLDVPADTVSLQSDAYADTQIDYDMRALPRSEASIGIEAIGDLDNAYADTQIDCNVAFLTSRHNPQETFSREVASGSFSAKRLDRGFVGQVVGGGSVDTSESQRQHQVDVEAPCETTPSHVEREA